MICLIAIVERTKVCVFFIELTVSLASPQIGMIRSCLLFIVGFGYRRHLLEWMGLFEIVSFSQAI